ncbi:hypothetical protein E0W80_10435 [Microbacterium sp. PI-1]|uniref:hypothetical protein n=1 Tax=Microbacterium sp. PI-1 TaxID=2545631 RepID=UPI00103EE1B3|nr:hypothetical protein [Microbacterium sp. PI-1]TCJ23550.1 hypothetical protein E0W80_10435 [Microbacterium sp. PI-1]
MTDEAVFEQLARRRAEKFKLPAKAADVLMSLGAALDGPLEPREMLVIQDAYIAMNKSIDEVYKHRSVLEQQVDHARARRALLSQEGIDIGEWSPE